MKKIICAGLLAAVLLGTAACASADGPLVGTWGDPAAKDRPSLEFTGDETEGSYGGTDGCNSVGGDYTVADGVIDLGLMRSTLMYCEGVDTWLTQGRTATIDGDTLTVLDEHGEEIGTLDRHG